MSQDMNENQLRGLLREAAMSETRFHQFDLLLHRARRARRLRQWGAAATAAVAVVGALFAPSLLADRRDAPVDQRPPISPAAVPWTDAPPPPVASPEPSSPPAANAPACSANDVAARPGESSGAGGHLLTQIVFRNVSDDECLLDGYPVVTASDAGRQDVVATNGSFFPNPPTGDLEPGDTAILGLETDTYCPARPDGGGGLAPYSRVSVELPGGGAVSLRMDLDVTCGVGITKFGVTPTQENLPPDPLAKLEAQMSLPAEIRAGDTLRYVVALINPTDDAIGLRECPGYTESGGPPSTKASYSLNCAAVGSLAAGETVRFAMEFEIPADAPPGTYRLIWSLFNGVSDKGFTRVTARS